MECGVWVLGFTRAALRKWSRTCPRHTHSSHPGLGFRVKDLGFTVEGLRFRFQGLGLRVGGLGFKV